MSALEKTAAALAGVQENLERAVDQCGMAASHADDAHHAATTMGSAAATAEAEDIQAVITTLRHQINRVLATAAVVAGTVRTVIHRGTGEPHRARVEDAAG